MKLRHSMYLVGCALAVGLPATVAAQTTGGDSAQAAQQGYGSQIVVTARRREEALQEVPLAITALSTEDLAEANITRMEDLSAMVSSLSISVSQGRAHTPAFAIRGQRQNLNYITNDPSVGIYVAEAVQGRPYGLGQSLFDLESVQVLKGPQGTLFGRNTTGGAILFQPRRPTLGQFDGYAQIRMGNYDLIEAQGAVSVPLNDIAALRVGFNRMVRDGYVKNVTTGNNMNDEDSTAARAVLLVEPSDGFKNTTYFDFFHANQLGSAQRITAVNPAGLAGRRGFDVILADQTQRLGYYETEGTHDGKSSGRNLGVTNVMEIELSPSLTFKNIANYREIQSYEFQNLVGTVQELLGVVDDQDSNQYSFEAQLLGENEAGTLTWILGGYYFQEKGTRITLTSVLGGTPNPRTGIGKNKSYSVFGQADYELVENLKATLGLRYTWDERIFTQELLSASTGNCIVCETRAAKFDDYTYTAGLSYQIDPDKLVYATTRRGYRAGGFNSSANSVGQLEPFNPETITDYELGFKADWDLGGAKLRTNFAGFYSNYNEIQRTAILVIDNVPIQTILNAASAHITGFELETNLWVGDFEFVGSASLTNPKYVEFMDAGIDQSDNEFGYIPKWMYRLGARYTAPVGLGEGSTTKFSVDWAWRDSVYNAEFNADVNFQKSYGLLNARIEFQDVFGSQVDFALWGTNLTKTKYPSTLGDLYDSVGYVYRNFGNPRFYGAELAIEF